MKEISVIIPTYKPQDYLWQCLESLERQTVSKTLYEVVIILNGCKEPYYSNISNRLKDYTMDVRLLQTDEAGVSYARNIGIENRHYETAEGFHLGAESYMGVIETCFLV